MIERFADAFFFLALGNPKDPAHARSKSYLPSLARDRIVTTAWVLTEVADALASPKNRPAFARLLTMLEKRNAVIIEPTAELFNQGIGLYLRRPDKSWSLTDCISFVVMADRGLTEALTGDRHFEQAGFKPLLLV